MKKAFVIIASVLTLIGVVVAGFGVYIVNTPEYALKKIVDDVNDSGIDGLYPHLTDNARETLDKVSELKENNIFDFIVDLVSRSQYVSVLKNNIKETKWEINDILKSKDKALVILSFNYNDKLTGTIELTMLAEDGEWKIDGLGYPEFDTVNLGKDDAK